MDTDGLGVVLGFWFPVVSAFIENSWLPKRAGSSEWQKSLSRSLIHTEQLIVMPINDTVIVVNIVRLIWNF